MKLKIYFIFTLIVLGLPFVLFAQDRDFSLKGVYNLQTIDCSQYKNKNEQLICNYFNILVNILNSYIQLLNLKLTSSQQDSLPSKQSDLQNPLSESVLRSTPETSEQSLTLLKVLSPNGGEVYKTGDTITIRWSGPSRGYVIIDLIDLFEDLDGIDGIYTRRRISTELSSVGEVKWKIPKDIYEGKNSYKIYINYTLQPDQYSSFYDVSDYPFSIIREPIITRLKIISPNGGEIWNRGSNQIIRWISRGEIESVSISFLYMLDGVNKRFSLPIHMPNTGIYYIEF